jgi:hypothetical protein
VNQNLLYLVARLNVERIHDDRRFDWIDNDFIKAVVAGGKELPGREQDHDHDVDAAVPSKGKRRRGGSKTKMAAMAARTRGRRTR